MQAFARLYAELDASTSADDRQGTLLRHLAEVPAADAAWGVYLLAGGKPPRSVPTPVLRTAAIRAAGLDDWLFEACHQAVGDLAETIALILPGAKRDDAEVDADAPAGLAAWMETRVLGLRDLPPDAQANRLQHWWRGLDAPGRFLLVKLIGGAWRVAVSKLEVQQALAVHAGLDAHLIAQRMAGYADARRAPTAKRFLALIEPDTLTQQESGQPHPFYLARPVEVAPEALALALGPVSHWLAEWRYEGMRVQIVKRGGQAWLWARGNELVSERFPEWVAQALSLPDGTVLDGELLAWQNGEPAPLDLLRPRLNRKSVTRALQAQAPTGFIAFDLLESDGIDRRSEPLQQRRSRLEAVMHELRGDTWRVSPRLTAADWAGLLALRLESRDRGFDGLMLKHLGSAYGVGRDTPAEQGAPGWWKWKAEPMQLDAVLTYAQAGQGRDASPFSDYTFAVWSRPPADAAQAQAAIEAIARREPARADALQLVTLAKASDGLSKAEFTRIDQVIRATLLEKFGPVRSVRPTLMVELAFDGLSRSPRHKSGWALRSPRMVRLRDDKPLHEACDLQRLTDLMRPVAAG